MRFKHTVKDYKQGDMRVIKKFLLLPVRIGNETRWIETAYLVQCYIRRYIDDIGYIHEWRNESFYNMCTGDYCPMCNYKTRRECEVNK